MVPYLALAFVVGFSLGCVAGAWAGYVRGLRRALIP